MFLINAAMEKISIGTAALIVVLGMAVVFFGLILLMCVTKIAGAIISRKTAAEPTAAPPATPDAPAAKHATAPGSAGKIALHDVPDKTAAGSFVMRDLVLRFYWDDEETPSVECPVGDFFCNGFGERAIVYSMPICVNPTGGMN